MPHSGDASKHSFELGTADKAELTKKEVADAGQKVEVEQHAATVAKQQEAEERERR